MPRFSAFTPFGVLRFSSAASEVENQYTALGLQLDGAFDPADPNNEAEKYATSRHLARINLTLQRAGNQRNVNKCLELLPLREADFIASHGPNDCPLQRQQRLAAAKLLPAGGTAANIRTALASMLGPAFLGLRIVAQSEALNDLPASTFQSLTIESKWVRLVLPVAVTGLQWASYANIDTTNPTPVILGTGDRVTVQGEHNAQAEPVTVASTQVTTAGVQQFQATFANAHDAGATVTTMPFPRWTSTRCMLFVEVTPAASVSALLRAQIDALMAKMTRGFVQWATVAVGTQTAGIVGFFIVGTSPLGTTTLGSMPQ